MTDRSIETSNDSTYDRGPGRRIFFYGPSPVGAFYTKSTGLDRAFTLGDWIK